MDKKILEKPTFDLDNTALECAIVDYTVTNNDLKKLQELINVFRESQVLVPVAFPQNIDIELVKKMLRGEPLTAAENFPLFPVTMSDQQGNKFAPAFTSRDKVLEAKDFPYMIRVSAGQVIANALNEKMELTGILLNPQTSAFIFRKEAFTIDFSKIQQQAQRSQVKKISRDEFVLIARNSVEKNLIPKQLFAERAEFVKQLEEGGEAFLRDLYGKPYGDKVPNPYTTEDFGIMALDIDEETSAICLELPKKNVIPGIAMSAYVIMNPKTNEVHYYMVEKGQPGEDDVLCNITPEGKHQELMTAPPTGSELSAVLDLIREEAAEQE